MILTLNIPTGPNVADVEHRAKLRRAADALLDAKLITPEQAVELAESLEHVPVAPAPLPQGSPEWEALLSRPGPGRGPGLSLEATSRESIYEDDLR